MGDTTPIAMEPPASIVTADASGAARMGLSCVMYGAADGHT